jgi:putative transcriptional regulator
MTARGQHLSDAWYLDHASGSLSLGESVFMDAHVEISDQGAQKLSDYLALGARIFQDSPADISQDRSAHEFAFDADEIMRIADLQPGPDATPSASLPTSPAEQEYLPDALRAFLQQNHQEIRWSYLGPKLRKCMLWKGADGTKLWMLKAEEGAEIPTHTHTGYELTLVLKGSFSDQSDKFERGHVQEADDDTHHEIIINPGEDCICLALTKAPLTFYNPIVRAFQLFTGI